MERTQAAGKQSRLVLVTIQAQQPYANHLCKCLCLRRLTQHLRSSLFIFFSSSGEKERCSNRCHKAANAVGTSPPDWYQTAPEQRTCAGPLACMGSANATHPASVQLPRLAANLRECKDQRKRVTREQTRAVLCCSCGFFSSFDSYHVHSQILGHNLRIEHTSGRTSSAMSRVQVVSPTNTAGHRASDRAPANLVPAQEQKSQVE